MKKDLVKRNQNYDPFEGVRKNFFEDFWGPFDFPEIKIPTARAPLVNIQDKGKEILITAEIPGVEKNNINVDAEEDYIKIEGELKNESEKEKKDFYRYERKYSSFSRMIPMPEKIIPEKVFGELKDGILTLTAPKAKVMENPKTKRVKIK
jgi:HSP20 family protein